MRCSPHAEPSRHVDQPDHRSGAPDEPFDRPLRPAGPEPWLDNLRRDWIQDGEHEGLDRPRRPRRHLQPHHLPEGDQRRRRLRRAVRRPARSRAHRCSTATGSSWCSDIRDALAVLRPVYDASDGVDGYVSVEVSPLLARDTDGTAAAARHLHDLIDRAQPLREDPRHGRGPPRHPGDDRRGPSVNVTLIFWSSATREVMEAYIAGLEANEPATSRRSSSVASFFVSRVDTEADKRLDAVGTPEAARPARARPPWPTPRSPTRRSSRPSPARGGRPSPPVGPGCSGRCGRPPPPRTRPTRRRSTSTPSSAPTR